MFLVGVTAGVAVGTGVVVGDAVGLGVGVEEGVGVGLAVLLIVTDALYGEDIMYPVPLAKVIVAVSLPDERFVVSALSVADPDLLPARIAILPGVPLNV